MPIDYSAAVNEMVAGKVAPNAEEVDQTGTFPGASISALGAAGLLGLLSAPRTAVPAKDSTRP